MNHDITLTEPEKVELNGLLRRLEQALKALQRLGCAWVVDPAITLQDPDALFVREKCQVACRGM